MTTKDNEKVFAFLDELFPDVGTELLYTTDFEFLFAVMMSAQTTDKRVNIVTRDLFKKYKTLEDYANAPLEDIEETIKSIGLYKNKAKNVKLTAQKLLKDFNGKVPSDKDALMSLPGVGVKTANVVRVELFKIPEVPVDTHVNRIAKRLGYANPEDNITVVEQKLRKAIKRDRYIKAHHQFIHFGRYFCKAQSPRCRDCKLVGICKEPHKNL